MPKKSNHEMANSLSTTIVLLLSCASAITFCRSLSSPQEIAQENLKKLAAANNEMALKLLRQLSSESAENVFFSPFSLSAAFGMLYYGTKGNAAKELGTALGYDAADLQGELVHQTFRQYLTEFLNSPNSTYVLSSANAVLLDKGLDIVPSYKRDVQDLYQALVQEVDFKADASRVAEDINKWVEDKTNGKIKELSDPIDPATAFLLLNAVYFKGTWNSRFDPERTKQETFYNNGVETEAKKVWMMKKGCRVPYTRYEDFQALELQYEGNNISMTILLPNRRDGLETMEKNLTLEKLSGVRSRMNRRSVYMTIPRFEIQYSRQMSQDFKSIGAGKVFGRNVDFSGIASNPNLSLDQVLHEAVLEVNEVGTVAAARTRVSGGRKSGGRAAAFIADHPFFFAIVDKRNDMILFLGHVTNL